MKKSKTFAEAVMAGAAAVALVGLVYAGGNSKTIDLKATNNHSITMTTSSTFCPTAIGDNRVTDTNLGLSSNGYMWIGLSGSGDGDSAPSKNLGWIIYSAVKKYDHYSNRFSSGRYLCQQHYCGFFCW